MNRAESQKISIQTSLEEKRVSMGTGKGIQSSVETMGEGVGWSLGGGWEKN